MIDGKVKGYFLLGQNPAVGSAHGRAQRLGMANLDWLVVRDLFMIESATFWKNGPEIETGEIVPEQCRTEVFFLPAASHVEKEGTFTQTQRLLQWREKAVDPPGDCRSELWFFYHLGRMIRERLAGLDPAARPGAARPDLGLPDARPARRAERRGGAARDQRLRGGHRPAAVDVHRAEGRRLHRRRVLDLLRGVRRRRQPGRPPQARRGAGPGWPPSGAGPGRPTGGSSTTAPPPTRTAGRGASGRSTSGGTTEKGEWTGYDVPDFEKTKPPSYRPPEGAIGRGGDRRRRPVHHAGRREGLAVRAGRAARRADADALRAGRVAGAQPALRPAGQPDPQGLHAADNPLNPSPPEAHSDVFPYVFTTSRLTEHHTAGGMSRTAAVPGRAAAGDVRRGVPGAGRRARADAPGLGARGHRPRGDRGAGAGHRPAHARCGSTAGSSTRSGCRTTGAATGLVTGDSANDLFGITLDPNVLIQESKVGTCDIRPGRRPTGPDAAGARRRLPAAAGRARPALPAGRHDRRHGHDREREA